MSCDSSVDVCIVTFFGAAVTAAFCIDFAEALVLFAYIHLTAKIFSKHSNFLM